MRILVLSLAVVAAVVVPVAPSQATTQDLFVQMPANNGDDSHDCSSDAPCATVAHAVAVADLSGTTIHVGPGTFSGQIDVATSVAIVGTGAAQTTLTAPDDPAGDGYVLGVGSGETDLSDVTLTGVAVDLVVFGTGSVSADHVVLGQSDCNAEVFAGSLSLTDSLVRDNAQSGCPPAMPGPPLTGGVVVAGGTVRLTRTQLVDPAVGTAAVQVSGGDLVVDQSLFDDGGHLLDTNQSSGIALTAGTATVTRSTFHGFGDWGLSNHGVTGGTALVSDSTFVGNVVGVDGQSGSTTVVRSTFTGELGALQGTVALAGSILGPDSIRTCNGTVTDLGYNLATDTTCGLSQATSHEGVSHLGLDDGLDDQGGPVPTVAITNPSPAVDSIPAGATYGASATPLCPVSGATDLRGVPRPAGKACDAGSMEMAATTTTLIASRTAKPHAQLTLKSTVVVPDVGVSGLGLPVGTVTYRVGSRALCAGVPVPPDGRTSCSTPGPAAGHHVLTATFTPADGSTLHRSASAARVLDVGTRPVVRGPHRVTVHVGRPANVRLRASGAPAPRLTVAAGRLPHGLVLHRGPGILTITGIPHAGTAGSYPVRVKATNLAGTGVRRLTIVVTRPGV